MQPKSNIINIDDIQLFYLRIDKKLILVSHLDLLETIL